MPILGTIASSYLATTPAVLAYDSIATLSANSTTKTLTFSSIPQTYTHLQIRGIFQYAAADNMEMTINGGTAVTRSHWIYGSGNGASNVAADVTSNTIVPQAGASSTDMYGIILDFIDYRNTNKNKVVRNLGGVDRNSAKIMWFTSILYATTTAISSITLQNPTHNFVNTSFSLYGIK